MKAVYPVMFTQTNDEKDTILIEVPDLEIITEGYGIADAIKMARDAIGLKGITLEDMKQSIPTPSKIKEVDLSALTFKDMGDSFVSTVNVNLKIYRKIMDNKSVRRNIALPNRLNREAEQAHINVSKVLQEALMEVLGLNKL